MLLDSFSNLRSTSRRDDVTVEARYLRLVSIFLFTDIVEWLVITFCFQLSTDDALRRNVAIFTRMIRFYNFGSSSNRLVMRYLPTPLWCMQVFLASYFGISIFQSRWDSWSMENIRKTVNIDDLQYEHLFMICPVK